ncbi:MAG: hypothetical protein KJ064_16680 [Anaerolineae bacterium]|nr:hypothetical protein [Anaerolineae bacterium]
MQDPEHCSVDLNAYALYKGDDNPSNEILAKLLSEAIIDVITAHKANGWRLVNMDFKGGNVTINFSRRRKRKGT